MSAESSVLSASGYSLVGGLPGVHQQDDFLARLVDGFDDALAETLVCIDNLDAYLDPDSAPVPWLGWLAGWVAMGLDETWTEVRQRRMVAAAGEVLTWRGTARGLRAALQAYTGSPVTVEDSGAVTVSRTPAGSVAVVRPATVTVRIGEPSEPITPEAVERIVVDNKPAHVRHVVALT